MAAKSDIQISMGLDFGAMQKSIDAVQKNVAKAMSAVKTAVLGAAAVLGIGFGVKEFIGGIAGAIAYGKQLDNLSRQNQVSVKDIVIMQHALDRAGVSADEAASMIGEFRDNMRLAAGGMSDSAMAANRLGVDFSALSKLSLPEQFSTLAQKINEIHDPLVRNAIAAQIFGAAGAKAIATMQSDNFSAEEAAGMLGKFQNRLHETSSSMSEAAIAAQGLGINLSTLSKLSLPEQFSTLAAKINTIRDPLARAAVAAQIFGAAGAKAIATMQGGDIKVDKTKAPSIIQGGDIKAAAGMIGDLQSRLRATSGGMSEASVAAKGLGIDLGMLSKLGLPEQFSVLAQKINSIRDPLARAAIAAQIFGAAGAKAFAKMQGGDLKNAMALYAKNAERMEATAAIMANVSDSWNRIKGAGEEFFNAMAGKIVPLLKPLFDTLEDLLPQVAEAGEKFGNWIAKAIKIVVQAFREGKMFELAGDVLTLAFETAVGVLNAGVGVVVKFLKESIAGIFGNVGTLLLQGFVMAVNKLASSLTTIIQSIVTLMQVGFRIAFGKIFSMLPKSRQNKVANPAQKEYLDTKKKDFGTLYGEELESSDKLFNPMVDSFNQNTTEAADKMMDAIGKVDVKKFISELAQAAVDGYALNSDKRKELQDKLKKLTDGLLKDFGETPAGKKIGEKPGQGKKSTELRAAPNMSFDELRKIGGGMGNSAQNIQQRQLDKLDQIANYTREMANSKPGATRGMTGTKSTPVFASTAMAGA